MKATHTFDQLPENIQRNILFKDFLDYDDWAICILSGEYIGQVHFYGAGISHASARVLAGKGSEYAIVDLNV